VALTVEASALPGGCGERISRRRQNYITLNAVQTTIDYNEENISNNTD